MFGGLNVNDKKRSMKKAKTTERMHLPLFGWIKKVRMKRVRKKTALLTSEVPKMKLDWAVVFCTFVPCGCGVHKTSHVSCTQTRRFPGFHYPTYPSFFSLKNALLGVHFS